MLFSRTLLTNIRAFSTYSIYAVWRDAALQCRTKQDDRPNIRKFEMILYEFHPDNSILCLYDRSLWQFGDGTLRSCHYTEVKRPPFFPHRGAAICRYEKFYPFVPNIFFFTRVAVPVSRQMILSKTGRSICRYYNVSVTVTNRYPLPARYTGVR